MSVLIPTRDRPDDLKRCLATVLACDDPDFEVFVVDQSGGGAIAPCADDARLRYRRRRLYRVRDA